MTPTTKVLEIHLEEIGQHYRWWKRMFTRGVADAEKPLLADFMNRGTYRFVARRPGPDQSPEGHIFGATFPVMGGARDLNNRNKPNGQWTKLVEESLTELDRNLVRDGWVRQPDIGPYWWSRKYTRTGS